MLCPECDSELLEVNHEEDTLECNVCEFSIDQSIVNSSSFEDMFPQLFDDIDSLDYDMIGD